MNLLSCRLVFKAVLQSSICAYKWIVNVEFLKNWIIVY